LHAQNVTRETVPGVTNFARVETTIACAGATTPAALAGLKKVGYASVINLREATERPGAQALTPRADRRVELDFLTGNGAEHDRRTKGDDDA